MRYYKLYYSPVRHKMKKANTGLYVFPGGHSHSTYCALEAKKFFPHDSQLRQKFYDKLSKGIAPFTSPHQRCYEDMEPDCFYISDMTGGSYYVLYKFYDAFLKTYMLYSHRLDGKEHKNDYTKALAEFARDKRPAQELFELQKILGNI